MSDKQVSFARHNIFYKIFFQKHKEMLEKFINLEFSSLKVGFRSLNVFYSAYSYYLEDVEDMKEKCKQSEKSLLSNDRYIYFNNKLSSEQGLRSFKPKEIKELNNMYYFNILSLFEVFESYCHKLASDDIFPKVTETYSEHDKNVLFASYETFYECLFNIHATIFEKLQNFNILDYIEIIRIMMAYFYGYSYYVGKVTRKKIKERFQELITLYNNDDFLKTYYKLLQGNPTPTELETGRTFQEKIFDEVLEIFEMINHDLPKQNIFPKKTERVLYDRWLI